MQIWTNLSDMGENNNYRIAKNTIYLYIRTGVTMLVSLYTSRIVLNALGVEDFGIWGVLGGVISIFGFINQSLSSSIFRYITHAIGTGNNTILNKTYNASIIIHIGLAILIFFLCETIGYWFLEEKLVIPETKRDMVNLVFQIVIVTSSISILSVPFNSVIIAYERMNIYAYLTIADTFFKLIVAAVVFLVSENKLVWYALMMLMTTIIMLIFYFIYVRVNFKNLKFQKVHDMQLFKSLLGFSGWSIFGNLAYVGYTQGLNMLINIFFGPVVNAARSISLQVEQTVRTFIGNFQTAINPQIIKDYAKTDYARMHLLMFRSSKFSVYLLLLFAIPIAMETDTILYLWLKQVPEHTVAFVRIMFCVIALETMSNSLMTGVVATGRIRNYQIAVGTILLTIVPISYFVLKSGYPPESVFIVYLAVEIIAVIARLIMANRLVRISIIEFLYKVVLKIIIVTVLSLIVPVLLHVFLPDRISSTIIVCTAGMIMTAIVIYLCGLEYNEKRFVIENIRQRLHL